MDTLKLQTNVPEVIALQFADGRQVASQFGGDQVMFSLCDGRRAYLPPFVADKIASAGIQPGELFEICKREIVAGNRRSVEYQIRTDIATGAPLATNTPAAMVSIAQNTARVQHTAAPPAAVPYVAPAGAAVHPAPAPVAVATVDAAAAAAVKTAGRIAIDAVLEVEQYARDRGMTDFVFGADNVQKILVSLYIDLRKGGRA